jgi:hypothetical protein
MTDDIVNGPRGIPAEPDRRGPIESSEPADPRDQPAPPEATPGGTQEFKPNQALVASSVTPELEAHSLANLFSRMEGEAFKALVASIREHKQQENIIMYQGKILDGRNRYAACREVGVEPSLVEYEGSDPLGYVMARNVHRRHLSASQRSLVAADLTNLEQGQRPDTSIEVSAVTIDQAAEKLSVGRASVERAKTVLASGDKILIDDVRRGRLSVSAAAKRLAEPDDLDDEIPEGEQQARKLESLWDKTGDEGRNLFLERVGAKGFDHDKR